MLLGSSSFESRVRLQFRFGVWDVLCRSNTVYFVPMLSVTIFFVHRRTPR